MHWNYTTYEESWPSLTGCGPSPGCGPHSGLACMVAMVVVHVLVWPVIIVPSLTVIWPGISV